MSRFVGELRRLRQLAGSPSLNQMAGLTANLQRPLPRSTISDKLTVKSLPEWDFVVSFVTACRAYAEKSDRSLPADLVDLARWDAAHWRMLRAVDEAYDDDRLVTAARTEIGRRASRPASAAHPSPRQPTGRAQPEPDFGGGEHAPSSPARAQPEPDFGGGGHVPSSSARAQPEPGPGGGEHAPRSPEANLRVVPRQLPAAVRHFAGRAAELETLARLADEAATAGGTVVISAIDGTAGIGKTAVAVHFAHRVAERYPDGQLYINLRGFGPEGSAVSPAEAVRGFLDALEVPAGRIPVGLDAQAALYRSLLAGRRTLVVLDNAQDVDQVRPLLPGSPGCLVLVTSRNRLTGLIAAEGAHPLTLDLLPAAEARELLANRLGRARAAAEPQAIEVIVAACAGLPLALSIVAARAAEHPGFTLDALASDLRQARGGLDAFGGGDPAIDIRAMFSWSCRKLSAPAGTLFRLLSLHPGPDVSTAAAASLSGVPSPRLRPVVAELARANLLSEHTPGRFVVHDLLRAYATELTRTLDSDEVRQAAVHRMLDHYLHTAHTAAVLLHPHREPITLPPADPAVTPEELSGYECALTWFTTEHAVLLAAVRQAAGSGFDTHAWQLAWTLGTFFERRGHWQDQSTVQNAALAAALRLGDRAGQALAHRGISFADIRLGRLDAAHQHLQQALDLYRQLGDKTAQGQPHLDLSLLFELQGRYVDALGQAQQAFNLYQAAGHRYGQAFALNAIGWDHALLGDYRQALTHCQQALDLLQEVGNRPGQAHAWDSLGYAHHHLGHHRQATACYRQAVALFEELGDRYNEAATLTRLGDAHLAAGDGGAARDSWHRALAILDQLGHPDAEQVRAKIQ